MTNPSPVIPASYHQNIKKVIFNQATDTTTNNNNNNEDDTHEAARFLFLKPQSASSVSLASSTYIKPPRYNKEFSNLMTDQNRMDVSQRVKENFERIKSKFHIGTSVLMNKYTFATLQSKQTENTTNATTNDLRSNTEPNFSKKPPPHPQHHHQHTAATKTPRIEIEDSHTFSSNFNKLERKANVNTSTRLLSSNSYFQSVTVKSRINSATTNATKNEIMNDPSIAKFSSKTSIGNLNIDLANLEKKLHTIKSQSAPIRKLNNNLNDNMTSSHHLLAAGTTTTASLSSSKFLNTNASSINQLKNSSSTSSANKIESAASSSHFESNNTEHIRKELHITHTHKSVSSSDYDDLQLLNKKTDSLDGKLKPKSAMSPNKKSVSIFAALLFCLFVNYACKFIYYLTCFVFHPEASSFLFC